MADRTAAWELRRICRATELGLVHQVVVRDDLADHIPLQRLLGVHRLRREEHLHRHADATGVDQAHQPAIAVVEPASSLEGAELGSLGRDPDVAGHRGLEPARQRPSVDRPDDRLSNPVHPAGEPVEAELDGLAQIARARVDEVRRDVGLEVGAGAERLARAGEDRDVHRVVVAEVRPRLDHQAMDVRVDRVPRLRAVDRHVRDPVALLVEHLRHGFSSLDAGGTDRMLRPNRRVLPTRSLEIEGARPGGLLRRRHGARSREELPDGDPNPHVHQRGRLRDHAGRLAGPARRPLLRRRRELRVPGIPGELRRRADGPHDVRARTWGRSVAMARAGRVRARLEPSIGHARRRRSPRATRRACWSGSGRPTVAAMFTWSGALAPSRPFAPSERSTSWG